MTKKKNHATLRQMEFLCSGAGTVIVEPSKLFFSASVQPCEVCGEHGIVEVMFDCPCNQTHRVELNSW